MKKVENITIKFFLGTGIFSITWILGISIFFPKMHRILSNIRATNGIYFISLLNIVCAILAILLLVAIKKIYKEKKLDNLNLIIIIELVFYFVFLLFLTKYYGIFSAHDDAGIVLSNAHSVLNTGKITEWYMVSNPQNLFLMYFYLLINKLIGSMSYNILFVIFALLSVATAFLIYKSILVLTRNKKNAFISMQFYIFCFQVSLHVTNIYTDTLSLFLVSLGTYFYLLSKDNVINYKTWLGIFITSVLFSLGFLAKGTTLVLIIAFCLELLLMLDKWDKLKIIIPLVVFFLVQLSWNSFIDRQDIYDTEKIGMPNTHYIFMGLNSGQPEGSTLKDRRYLLNGSWNQGDLNISKKLFFEKKLSKNEITGNHVKYITDRLSNFTMKSGFEFVNSKIATSWSTGDLKSTYSVVVSGENKENVDKLNNSYLAYIFMQTLQFVYYFVALFVFVQALRNKIPLDSLVLLSAIFTIGMFLFLLLWESSPRYVMSLIPFYIILISKYLTDTSLEPRREI